MMKAHKLYGYRCDDYNHIKSNRESIINNIQVFEENTLQERDVVATSLPVCFKAVASKCSLNDVPTQITGLRHRIGGRVPALNFSYLKDFKKFIDNIIPKLFEPMPYDTDVTMDHYLKVVNLPAHKKEKMLKEYNQYVQNDRKVKISKIKMHMKEEFYPEYKHIRGIFAREDTVKMLFGPMVHAMEEHVFNSKWFAKKISGNEKAKSILQRFFRPGCFYYGTDFESWESSCNEHIIETVELTVYEYLLKDLPESAEFLLNYKQITGVNILKSKFLKLYVKARRMSGEMTTSLGNGLINLLLLLYCLHLNGISYEQAEVIVEGDDGLTMTSKPLGTRCFKELGFVCKLLKFDDVRTSSFCGMIFSKPGHTIRNWMPSLAKFGWCSRKYNNASFKTRMALMRAKALSMIYENPHCPILRPFADRICYLTRNYKAKFDTGQDMYHYNIYLKSSEFRDLPKAEICSESRAIFSELYNIDPQTQRDIEERLSKINLYDELWDFNVYFNTMFVDNYGDYVDHCYLENFNRNGLVTVGAVGVFCPTYISSI